MDIKVSEIIAATGGALLRGNPGATVTGVSTDSRAAASGAVFFAIKGPRFDGHDFIKEVSLKGAAAAVVERDVSLDGVAQGLCVIKVSDTVAALGSLALYWRSRHPAPMVAITGSAGKTTTKEMAAAMLGVSRRILKTEGNKNNLIGLPLTLLGLDGTYTAAVVELGISERGEMRRLVEMSAPDVAVITNIGRSHLKTLGSVEGVAREKGELFRLMKPGGVRVVNMDDPWAARLAGDAKNIVTFSVGRAADVRVLDYGPEGDSNGVGGMRAVYDVRGKKINVKYPSPAVSNIINGAAAIAACVPFDVTVEEIAAGLGAFTPVRGRMEVVRVNGLTVLDDTYNANPDSMESALHTLKGAHGRKVAVLGDMLELGEAAAKEHREIGRLAAESGVDVIVAVGMNALHVGQGAVFMQEAQGAGKNSTRVFCCKDKAGALGALKDVLREGDTVLVKGSRGIALEDVVERIKGLDVKK